MAANLPHRSASLRPVNVPSGEEAAAKCLELHPKFDSSVSQENNSFESKPLNSLKRVNSKQSVNSELAPSSVHSSQENLLSSQENILSSQDNLSQDDSIQENLLSDSGNIEMQNYEYLWFRDQELPKVGVRFDVTVTQVDQPDIIYIQRFPPSEDDPLLTNDREDGTAEKAYDQINELENLSYLINTEGYFSKESRMPLPIIGKYCALIESYAKV